MNLCSFNHDEICHENSTCPLCEKVDDFNGSIKDLKDEISNLQNEIQSLEEKNE